jgi:flavin-dependent trigonelline monooxygenase, oxygenase component
VKFSLFVHMERLDAGQSHESLYEEMIELCLMADRGGMVSVWTGEHHGMDFTIAPNPFLNLCDLARRTTNVRLGTSSVIAPFWHPIRLAGEAAMSDIIAGGRLDVGIARGAYGFEYERMLPGLDAAQAGKMMRELVPAIKGVWAGDYAHDGEYWQFPATTSAPKPLQQPHPPLWIAARDPASHDFAVANGCHVQVTPLALGDDEIVSLMDKFQTACAAHPEVERPRIMLLRHTYVASDEADATQAASELSRYYHYFGAWFRNVKPIHQGVIEAVTDDEMAANPQYSPEHLRTNAVVGQADEVIARLKYAQSLGYDEYSIWIDSGMSFERKRDSLRRFIDEVMPAFADD